MSKLYLLFVLIVLGSCRSKVDYEVITKYPGKGYSTYVIHYKNGDSLLYKIDSYESGVLKSKVPYNANDKMHGEGRWWYESGELRTIGIYSNGQKHGDFVFYHPNAKIQQESTYKNNLLDGETKVYHDNGQISKHAIYYAGKRVGTWKYWDITGKLIMEEEYRNNELVRTKAF